jgi:hypothetical protein
MEAPAGEEIGFNETFLRPAGKWRREAQSTSKMASIFR